jgi:tetratricopeptide (TPR) repeat protein
MIFNKLIQKVWGNGNIVVGGNLTINPEVSPELLAKYAKELGATEQVIRGFLSTLLEHDVPREQWDSKLREIAAQHKELLASEGTDQAAKQAIKEGDYAKAEVLLEDVARRHTLAAAEANAAQARLQRIQYRHAKAAAYWQKAAALLPEDSKKERSLYLHEAGYDLNRIGKYREALTLYEQSLSISREIGDKEGEGATLSNIGEIYRARGDKAKSLQYYEQSLTIFREIGGKEGEGAMLNNIGEIYRTQGDYAVALTYLEPSLVISQEIGDKVGEGTTLNNIGLIYDARGDCTAAMKYLEQNLILFREIGDKRGEAVTSWNIGLTYAEQGDLKQAQAYISRAVELAEEIGHPSLEEYREALEVLRAKLKAQPQHP